VTLLYKGLNWPFAHHKGNATLIFNPDIRTVSFNCRYTDTVVCRWSACGTWSYLGII